MTPYFGPQPQFKIEIGSETYTNDQAFTLQIVRPENNISYSILQVNDYKSSKYEDVFDALDTVTLSLRYGSDSWTEVFEGAIGVVSPKVSVETGEFLEVLAWGKGEALAKTHCNTSYGLESENSTKETPQEIWIDLVTNYINKSFGGANTGHAITTAKIADIHNDIDVTNLTSPYLDNFTLINRVCDLVQAHVGIGVASCHWFVDPDANLFINTIGNHENNATGWPTYYGGSQALSTIEVAKDMILYDFRKDVTQEYANKVILCSNLRKPGYDYWTEDSGGAALWGSANMTTFEDSAVQVVVGSHSLHMEMDSANPPGSAYFPSAQNAAWDLTSIGSINTIPTLNFYLWKDNQVSEAQSSIQLCTDAANYFQIYWNTWADDDSKWIAKSIPVGPYWNLSEEHKLYQWAEQGNPDWSDINYIKFIIVNAAGVDPHLYLDDLHFCGKVIREAYHSTDITNNDEYQAVFRNDMALDDTLKATTDTGTVAALAKAELIRRRATPIVGMIQTPMIPDILPGQLVHIHACKKADGTFKIDKDFRIKEIRHTINPPPQGARTALNLTDDVYNSHAFAVPTLHTLIMEYAGALGHREAKNLKGSGIDTLIPKLSIDYG